MSNYHRAVDLLKKVGAYPSDLYAGVVDPRWPAMDEKIRVVEAELDSLEREAERRGYDDGRDAVLAPMGSQVPR